MRSAWGRDGDRWTRGTDGPEAVTTHLYKPRYAGHQQAQTSCRAALMAAGRLEATRFTAARVIVLPAPAHLPLLGGSLGVSHRGADERRWKPGPVSPFGFPAGPGCLGLVAGCCPLAWRRCSFEGVDHPAQVHFVLRQSGRVEIGAELVGDGDDTPRRCSAAG